MAVSGIHHVTVIAGRARGNLDFCGVTLLADAGRARLRARGPGRGRVVDLLATGAAQAGRTGHGGVHHLAFRVADDAAQAACVRPLAEWHGIAATSRKDRDHFREPGDLSFELATYPPGFAVDEPGGLPGQTLCLPSLPEPQRAAILGRLPPLD